jgi:hypothetical protein
LVALSAGCAIASRACESDTQSVIATVKEFNNRRRTARTVLIFVVTSSNLKNDLDGLVLLL